MRKSEVGRHHGLFVRKTARARLPKHKPTHHFFKLFPLSRDIFDPLTLLSSQSPPAAPQIPPPLYPPLRRSRYRNTRCLPSFNTLQSHNATKSLLLSLLTTHSHLPTRHRLRRRRPRRVADVTPAGRCFSVGL